MHFHLQHALFVYVCCYFATLIDKALIVKYNEADDKHKGSITLNSGAVKGRFLMNTGIRNSIKAAGLKQWQVAKRLGITEYTFIRWLRDDLTDARKKAINEAIEALQREGV